MSTNKCEKKQVSSNVVARVFHDRFNKICELTYIDQTRPGEYRYCKYNSIKNKCTQRTGFLGFGRCAKRESIWEAWYNNSQNCPKDF